jgi:ABC-type sulfate transport system substrate-binding protein
MVDLRDRMALPTRAITVALAYDIDAISEPGLIAHDWQRQRFG